MPKILIVDEGPAVRMLLDGALIEDGIEVLCAATGAEATAQIEREVPDLVICDVYMPDMDGYRICEFVKSHPRLATTPVLLMADVVDAMVLARAARGRPDDVLRKPFAADQLLGRIRSLLPPALPAEPTRSHPGEGSEAGGAADLKHALEHLAALPGVALSVLVDAEGFLIERAGEMASEAEGIGAVMSRLAGSSGRIGRELGHGRLRSMSLEHEGGLVLLCDAGDGATLGIVLRDAAMLETVRCAAVQAPPACSGHEGLTMVGAA